MNTNKIMWILIVFIWMLGLVILFSPVTSIGYVRAEEQMHIKTYAFDAVLNKWGDKQWSYFSDLIYRESNWESNRKNPNSSAFGLGQFLKSTWETVDCEKTEDPYKQIDCAIKYVELRYGTPKKAIEWHNKNNWY
jgi:membrane-bound lytic murein transglycosylase MltF